jgi:hypothetical protein
MSWFQWLSLGSLAVCLLILLYHFLRLLQLGKPDDLAKPSGKESDGIRYSFTQGMNPRKKESAYLHLPTYAAGMIYHTGTFLAFGLFILFAFGFDPTDLWSGILSGYLLIALLSGVFILIKRVALRKLRILSNPDDYISNILVSTFQAATIMFLVSGSKMGTLYHLVASMLFLYLPLGKLKHLVYFFAARYQLGLFYGRRGVWR